MRISISSNLEFAQNHAIIFGIVTIHWYLWKDTWNVHSKVLKVDNIEPIASHHFNWIEILFRSVSVILNKEIMWSEYLLSDLFKVCHPIRIYLSRIWTTWEVDSIEESKFLFTTKCQSIIRWNYSSHYCIISALVR